MSKILENIDALLKKNNMSRADLARMLGTSQSTISSWYARGTDRMGVETMRKVAACLNVTIDELLNGDDTPTALVFCPSEYTPKELELIAGFAKMLKESR